MAGTSQAGTWRAIVEKALAAGGAWETFQMPTYPDASALCRVEQELAAVPPLVTGPGVRKLKKELARVCEGKAFLLQGGDCAESFDAFRANPIRDTFKVLLQMAVVLAFGGATPVVKIGRMAGQYAKPRSAPTEMIDGVEYTSYRGDMINGVAATAEARTPDPQRMIDAYFRSAATLNLLRAFASGGFADLHEVHKWTLDFASKEPQAARYQEMTDRIQEALAFMEACGLTGQTAEQIRSTGFYTSHEALLLPYEQALTRKEDATGSIYCLSAHMLWIGERTRDPNGPHVEFLSHVGNPLGVKAGPGMTGDDLLTLCDRLNPENEAGKLTIITRMGADRLRERLPELVEHLRREGRKVIWSCDPMHANTVKTSNGYKTRPFERVVAEIQAFFDVHNQLGSHPGAVHLELTGQEVTECLGGVSDITEEGLESNYDTSCDPRLNDVQSLELAFLLAEMLKKKRQAA